MCLDVVRSAKKPSIELGINLFISAPPMQYAAKSNNASILDASPVLHPLRIRWSLWSQSFLLELMPRR